MLPRFLTALCFLIPFAPVTSFAHDGSVEKAITQHLKCQQLLENGEEGNRTFEFYNSENSFRLDVSHGFGYRRYKGQYPGESVASTIQAFQNGAMWWEYSIAFARSIEEARADDEKHDHAYKMAYLITDMDVSQFDANTPRPWLVKAFSDAFASSPLIEFRDNYNEQGKKVKLPGNRYEIVIVDKSQFSEIIDINEVTYSKDKHGSRFKLWGWTFPEYRGVSFHDQIFKLNVNGRIANDDIRRIINKMIAFEEAGGKIVWNRDFNKALDRAKNMERDDGNGNKVKNSRYYEDPHQVPVALEMYARGDAFSAEAYDKDGRLLAGGIFFRVGNMISGDTVFFDDPVTGQMLDPDLARMVELATAMRMNRLGIPLHDVNVVTPFTKQVGGVYIPAANFSELHRVLSAQRPTFLEYDKPFSLRELPYSIETRADWLDSKPKPGAPAGQKKQQQKQQREKEAKGKTTAQAAPQPEFQMAAAISNQ